jgi:hypothetical protein
MDGESKNVLPSMLKGLLIDGDKEEMWMKRR